MRGYPFAPIQILTGDIWKPRNARRGRLHDDGRSFQPKSRIERRFESSPESRGSQTSGVLPVLFVQAKRIKLFPFGKFRGSTNLDSARRNSGFAQTKLKPSQRELRGSANLESTHKGNNFAQTKLKPFETFRFADSLSLPGRHTPCAFFAALGGAFQAA